MVFLVQSVARHGVRNDAAARELDVVGPFEEVLLGMWILDELRAPKADVAVLLLTFGLTVIVDLTVAIEVGMVLSAFLFMHRMAEVTNVSAIKRELVDKPDPAAGDVLPRLDIPDGVQVFEIRGAFFFGAAETFKEAGAFVEREENTDPADKLKPDELERANARRELDAEAASVRISSASESLTRYSSRERLRRESSDDERGTATDPA